MATLEPPPDQTVDRIDVPVRRLDDIVADAGVDRIGLLKIDVEGWERQVLDGAKDCLQRTDRVVLELDRGMLPAVEQRLAAARFTIRGVIDGVWGRQEMAVLYAHRGSSAPPSGRLESTMR
jgi:Methyltransferase FkbM domain